MASAIAKADATTAAQALASAAASVKSEVLQDFKTCTLAAPAHAVAVHQGSTIEHLATLALCCCHMLVLHCPMDGLLTA